MGHRHAPQRYPLLAYLQAFVRQSVRPADQQINLWILLAPLLQMARPVVAFPGVTALAKRNIHTSFIQLLQNRFRFALLQGSSRFPGLAPGQWKTDQFQFHFRWQTSLVVRAGSVYPGRHFLRDADDLNLHA